MTGPFRTHRPHNEISIGPHSLLCALQHEELTLADVSGEDVRDL